MKDDCTFRRRPSRENRSAAFTLVEMLTVMGVISILIALALPNLRGLNQTAARRQAVIGVMNALDRARVMAVSDGRATYVAFAKKTDGSIQLAPDLWGRAYAIFQDKDNTSFQPVQVTPWLYLPNSMAFKIAGDYTSVMDRPLSPTSNPSLPGGDPSFPLSGAAGTGATTLPYLKFEPTGMVDQQNSKYLRVLMFPGSISAAGDEIATQKDGATTPALFEEVDVNSMTGRARYVLDPADNLSESNVN